MKQIIKNILLLCIVFLIGIFIILFLFKKLDLTILLGGMISLVILFIAVFIFIRKNKNIFK